MRFEREQVFRLIGVSILLFGILWYASFQARNLIAGPEISLTKEPDIVQTSRTVVFEGTTKNIVSLTLNGKQIFTDETGTFRTSLVLPDGYTIMTLRAKDRYGRVAVLSRPLVHTPPSDSN